MPPILDTMTNLKSFKSECKRAEFINYNCCQTYFVFPSTGSSNRTEIIEDFTCDFNNRLLQSLLVKHSTLTKTEFNDLLSLPVTRTRSAGLRLRSRIVQSPNRLGNNMASIFHILQNENFWLYYI